MLKLTSSAGATDDPSCCRHPLWQIQELTSNDMPAVPVGLCTGPADVGGIASPPRLNPAPVLAEVAAPKVGKLLAGCCSAPKPPGVPNVGAAEAALTAGVPAAAANAGADVVGDPKPKPPPAAGAPEPKPVLAGPPKDGTAPTPKAGADAPNAGVDALPNDGADPPSAGVLDAPNAAPLAPKLQALLADDKPPNAGVEALPNGAAAEAPIDGVDPLPKPADAGLITSLRYIRLRQSLRATDSEATSLCLGAPKPMPVVGANAAVEPAPNGDAPLPALIGTCLTSWDQSWVDAGLCEGPHALAVLPKLKPPPNAMPRLFPPPVASSQLQMICEETAPAFFHEVRSKPCLSEAGESHLFIYIRRQSRSAMQALQSRAAVLDPLRWTPSDHRLRLRSSAAVRSEATGVRR